MGGSWNWNRWGAFEQHWNIKKSPLALNTIIKLTSRWYCRVREGMGGGNKGRETNEDEESGQTDEGGEESLGRRGAEGLWEDGECWDGIWPVCVVPWQLKGFFHHVPVSCREKPADGRKILSAGSKSPPHVSWRLCQTLLKTGRSADGWYHQKAI